MYGFSIHLTDSFDHALMRAKEALQNEGFGVLTTIDVQATLKAKLGIEKSPYVILGACNPPLAHQALEADADIGLLLPCNVVVREEGEGKVTIAFMDPGAVLGLVENTTVSALGAKVREKLLRVSAALRDSSSRMKLVPDLT